MQFHILSFEGPDPYARAGGIATRVQGLSNALSSLGFETHLWFMGDPDLPGEERHGSLHLHRWGQWISRYHPLGVYDGEEGKRRDYAASLPPHLLQHAILPHVRAGERAVVLAEEWHTADAVLHLDWLLRQAGIQNRVNIFWNANNTFGFDQVDWNRLSGAATITTVSKYMKHLMWRFGVDALVIPNGLSKKALETPSRKAVWELRRRLGDRVSLTKVARWDPDKRWLATIDIVRDLKQRRMKPLLIARGGVEAHGADVLRTASASGLRVEERRAEPGLAGLLKVLGDAGQADMLNLQTHIDPESRRVLFRASSAVLANSGHEPFGLVGLEAMAAGGLACTGCSGEDYAHSGRNALVLETSDPREFIGLFSRLRALPGKEAEIRRSGRLTAAQYAWPEIIERILLPRIDIQGEASRVGVGMPLPMFAPEENEPRPVRVSPRRRPFDRRRSESLQA